MPLFPGTSLGPYQIDAPLGAGGHGPGISGGQHRPGSDDGRVGPDWSGLDHWYAAGERRKVDNVSGADDRALVD